MQVIKTYKNRETLYRLARALPIHLLLPRRIPASIRISRLLPKPAFCKRALSLLLSVLYFSTQIVFARQVTLILPQSLDRSQVPGIASGSQDISTAILTERLFEEAATVRERHVLLKQKRLSRSFVQRRFGKLDVSGSQEEQIRQYIYDKTGRLARMFGQNVSAFSGDDTLTEAKALLKSASRLNLKKSLSDSRISLHKTKDFFQSFRLVRRFPFSPGGDLP